MPSTLAQFTLGTTAASDDFIVGYDTAVLGGERRWSVSTMANAISGVMNTQLNSLIDSKATLIVPTGVVSYFASTTAPQGWIECNGATITTNLGPSYTALRNLLVATGYAFNTGTSPFSDPQVPNIRGIFIRGTGSQAIGTLTYSGTIGVRQNDAMQGHIHTTSGELPTNNSSSGYKLPGSTVNVAIGNQAVFKAVLDGAVIFHSHTISGPSNDGTNGAPRTGAETNPANISLLACIKL